MIQDHRGTVPRCQGQLDKFLYLYMGVSVFPKIMVPPNHPFVHRVFHEINHPFWGGLKTPPIFGSTAISRVIGWSLARKNFHLHFMNPTALGQQGTSKAVATRCHPTHQWTMDPWDPMGRPIGGVTKKTFLPIHETLFIKIYLGTTPHPGFQWQIKV